MLSQIADNRQFGLSFIYRRQHNKASAYRIRIIGVIGVVRVARVSWVSGIRIIGVIGIIGVIRIWVIRVNCSIRLVRIAVVVLLIIPITLIIQIILILEAVAILLAVAISLVVPVSLIIPISLSVPIPLVLCTVFTSGIAHSFPDAAILKKTVLLGNQESVKQIFCLNNQCYGKVAEFLCR